MVLSNFFRYLSKSISVFIAFGFFLILLNNNSVNQIDSKKDNVNILLGFFGFAVFKNECFTLESNYNLVAFLS